MLLILAVEAAPPLGGTEWTAGRPLEGNGEQMIDSTA